MTAVFAPVYAMASAPERPTSPLLCADDGSACLRAASLVYEDLEEKCAGGVEKRLVLLVGMPGCGRSTLAHFLAGSILKRTRRGSAVVDGHDAAPEISMESGASGPSFAHLGGNISIVDLPALRSHLPEPKDILVAEAAAHAALINSAQAASLVVVVPESFHRNHWLEVVSALQLRLNMKDLLHKGVKCMFCFTRCPDNCSPPEVYLSISEKIEDAMHKTNDPGALQVCQEALRQVTLPKIVFSRSPRRSPTGASDPVFIHVDDSYASFMWKGMEFRADGPLQALFKAYEKVVCPGSRRDDEGEAMYLDILSRCDVACERRLLGDGGGMAPLVRDSDPWRGAANTNISRQTLQRLLPRDDLPADVYQARTALSGVAAARVERACAAVERNGVLDEEAVLLKSASKLFAFAEDAGHAGTCLQKVLEKVEDTQKAAAEALVKAGSGDMEALPAAVGRCLALAHLGGAPECALSAASARCAALAEACAVSPKDFSGLATLRAFAAAGDPFVPFYRTARDAVCRAAVSALSAAEELAIGFPGPSLTEAALKQFEKEVEEAERLAAGAGDDVVRDKCVEVRQAVLQALEREVEAGVEALRRVEHEGAGSVASALRVACATRNPALCTAATAAHSAVVAAVAERISSGCPEAVVACHPAAKLLPALQDAASEPLSCVASFQALQADVFRSLLASLPPAVRSPADVPFCTAALNFAGTIGILDNAAQMSALRDTLCSEFHSARDAVLSPVGQGSLGHHLPAPVRDACLAFRDATRSLRPLFSQCGAAAVLEHAEGDLEELLSAGVWEAAEYIRRVTPDNTAVCAVLQELQQRGVGAGLLEELKGCAGDNKDLWGWLGTVTRRVLHQRLPEMQYPQRSDLLAAASFITSVPEAADEAAALRKALCYIYAFLVLDISEAARVLTAQVSGSAMWDGKVVQCNFEAVLRHTEYGRELDALPASLRLPGVSSMLEEALRPLSAKCAVHLQGSDTDRLVAAFVVAERLSTQWKCFDTHAAIPVIYSRVLQTPQATEITPTVVADVTAAVRRLDVLSLSTTFNAASEKVARVAWLSHALREQLFATRCDVMFKPSMTGVAEQVRRQEEVADYIQEDDEASAHLKSVIAGFGRSAREEITARYCKTLASVVEQLRSLLDDKLLTEYCDDDVLWCVQNLSAAADRMEKRKGAQGALLSLEEQDALECNPLPLARGQRWAQLQLGHAVAQLRDSDMATSELHHLTCVVAHGSTAELQRTVAAQWRRFRTIFEGDASYISLQPLEHLRAVFNEPCVVADQELHASLCDFFTATGIASEAAAVVNAAQRKMTEQFERTFTNCADLEELEASIKNHAEETQNLVEWRDTCKRYLECPFLTAEQREVPDGIVQFLSTEERLVQFRNLRKHHIIAQLQALEYLNSEQTTTMSSMDRKKEMRSLGALVAATEDKALMGQFLEAVQALRNNALAAVDAKGWKPVNEAICRLLAIEKTPSLREGVTATAGVYAREVMRRVEVAVSELSHGAENLVSDIPKFAATLTAVEAIGTNIEACSAVAYRRVNELITVFMEWCEDSGRGYGGIVDLGDALNADETGKGRAVIQKYPHFKGEQLRMFNTRVGTVDPSTVMASVAELNPDVEIIPEFQTACAEVLAEWSACLEALKGDLIALRPPDLDGLVTSIREAAAESKTVLLGRLFALWTGMGLEFYRKSAMQEFYLKKPHPCQVLAACALVGAVTCPGGGRMMQIATGEGKSIVLAVAAAALTLCGKEVSVLCYSPYLSGRDHAEFASLFGKLELDVDYGIHRDMCERLTKAANIRDTVRNFITTGEMEGIGNIAALPSSTERVLLVDEVDAFFGEEIYGATYNPCFFLEDDDLEPLVQKIWEGRATPVEEALAALESDSLCNKILEKYPESHRELLRKQMRSMVSDARKMRDDDPVFNEGVWKESGEIRMGYREMDTVRYNHCIGYRTLFAEYDEYKKRGGQMPSPYFRILCGSLSYPRVLLETFSQISGVSGTLPRPGTVQYELLNALGITSRVVLPSFYRSKLTTGGVKVVKGDVAHREEVLREIEERRAEEGRPVLVFFEEKAKLEACAAHRPGVVTNVIEETLTEDEVPSRIVMATQPGAVTFATRPFGRGLDFSCNHKVLESGGLHVVQTFIGSESEDIQIKGRTARQGEAGSFVLILEEEEIARVYGADAARAADDASQIPSIIQQRREALAAERFTAVQPKTEDHQKTRAFIERFGAGDSEAVLSQLLEWN